MKKRVGLVIGLLCMAGFALADVSDNVIAEPVKSNIAKEADLPKWQLYAQTFSTNDFLPNRVADVIAGYKVGALYNMTKQFYIGANAAYLAHDLWGFGAVLGMQNVFGAFKHYVEMTYDADEVKNENAVKHYVQKIGYDTGLQLIYFDHFQPYFQANNFAMVDQGTYEIGLSIPFSKGIALGLAYDKAVTKDHDGAKVKLSYAF